MAAGRLVLKVCLSSSRPFDSIRADRVADVCVLTEPQDLKSDQQTAIENTYKATKWFTSRSNQCDQNELTAMSILGMNMSETGRLPIQEAFGTSIKEAVIVVDPTSVMKEIKIETAVETCGVKLTEKDNAMSTLIENKCGKSNPTQNLSIHINRFSSCRTNADPTQDQYPLLRLDNPEFSFCQSSSFPHLGDTLSTVNCKSTSVPHLQRFATVKDLQKHLLNDLQTHLTPLVFSKVDRNVGFDSRSECGLQAAKSTTILPSTGRPLPRIINKLNELNPRFQFQRTYSGIDSKLFSQLCLPENNSPQSPLPTNSCI